MEWFFVPFVLRKLSWQSTQHIPTMVMSYGRTIHIRNHKSEICPIMKPSPVLVPYNLPCYHHRIILVLVALVVGIIYNSQTKARTIPGIYIYMPIEWLYATDPTVSWTGKLLATMLPVQESSMGSQPLLTGGKPYQPKGENRQPTQPNLHKDSLLSIITLYPLVN